MIGYKTQAPANYPKPKSKSGNIKGFVINVFIGCLVVAAVLSIRWLFVAITPYLNNLMPYFWAKAIVGICGLAVLWFIGGCFREPRTPKW